MDLTIITLIALAIGTVSGILGYFGRLWKYLYWHVKIPVDVMQILIAENIKNKGRNIKFQEDKVDTLNPTSDSGILINRKWSCSYTSERKEEKSTNFTFFGIDSADVSYSISSFRTNRGKILSIINQSMEERNAKRKNKIYIVTPNSLYYVGKIVEKYTDIPKIIEENLNHERTERLNIFLHGKIGTGKTSMARAIAQKMKVPIYILGIDSWWGVTDFVRSLQRIPDNSMILFDDIDLILEQVLRANVKNNSSSPLKFSTASIMAFLDGIFMKEKKWIVVMCTNEPEKVRKLLRLRAGRVHIDYKCTQVHSDDYIKATQEANKITKKFLREKKKRESKKG